MTLQTETAAGTPCVTAMAPDAGASARRLLLIIVTVACGNFLTGLDQNIVTTALPAMAASFGERPEHLSMAITSYVLGLAVFVPVSGWAADRFGVRQVYAGAVLLFTFASVLCGLAPNLWALATARALQGVGGAIMIPVGQLVVLQSFPKHRLLRVNNQIQLASILGPMIAPLLGGVLTETLSWSWIFYVNVPVGIVAAAMAWYLFRGMAPAPVPARFDAWGFLLVAVAVLALQLAVDGLGGTLLSGPLAIILFLAALLSGAAFVIHARRITDPLLDIRLLRIRTFRIPYLTSGVCDGLGICSMVFLLPMLLQIGFGMSALESGGRTFFVMVGALIMRGFVPGLIRRLRFRRMMMTTTVVSASVVGSFALIRPDTPDWLLVGAMIAFGMARTAQFFSSTNLAYSDVPRDQLSRYTPLATVIGQLEISASIGIAAAMLSLLAGADGHVSAGDFRIVFAFEALFILAALYGYSQLRPGDGAHIIDDPARAAPPATHE